MGDHHHNHVQLCGKYQNVLKKCQNVCHCVIVNSKVMSMDSRIANKDKTILSLQLEELEPVFMGKKDEDITVL